VASIRCVVTALPCAITARSSCHHPAWQDGRVSRSNSVSVRPVGAYQVLALLDAAGTFFLPATAAFPEATEADWVRARQWDPGAFGPDGAWRLPFRCFAVRRADGRTILVDAGVGPENSPAAAWAPVPGRLPAELAAAGVDPDDVDTV